MLPFIRYLEFKAHKELLFKILCYPFDEIITGKYIVFQKYNNIIILFLIIHVIF